MPTFEANDGSVLHYQTHGSSTKKPLILLHGFTGSGQVFKRNVAGLSEHHYVLVPDLRGHGDSGKPRAGYHVARLAIDLRNFLEHMDLQRYDLKGELAAVGTSLGAAILWCYAELYTTGVFSHLIFVDQAPLQNYLSDWGPEYGNRGLNNPEALENLQHTLQTDPQKAHIGTIDGCLGYRSYPMPGDPDSSSKVWQEDEAFFLAEAMKGDGWWYGKLMADHTAKDWRSSIAHDFGPASGSQTRVLVVASERSGCFPAAGPMKVVELVNGDRTAVGNAEGHVVKWGGHWCYWEEPEMFNRLVSGFIANSTK